MRFFVTYNFTNLSFAKERIKIVLTLSNALQKDLFMNTAVNFSSRYTNRYIQYYTRLHCNRINYERHCTRGNIASTRLIRARVCFPVDSGHRERNQDNWPELVARLNNCPASGPAFIRCYRIGRPSTFASDTSRLARSWRPIAWEDVPRKGSLSSSSNPSRRWNRSNELKEKRRNTVRSICATNADQRVSIRGEIINGQGRTTRIFGKKLLLNEGEWIYSFVKCKFRESVFPGCTMVDDKRPCDSWSAWTSIKFPSLYLFPLLRTWPTIHLAD